MLGHTSPIVVVLARVVVVAGLASHAFIAGAEDFGRNRCRPSRDAGRGIADSERSRAAGRGEISAYISVAVALGHRLSVVHEAAPNDDGPAGFDFVAEASVLTR